MKTLLCLAALAVLTVAYPIAVEDPYKYLHEKYGPEPFRYGGRVAEYDDKNTAPLVVLEGKRKLQRGDSACDRQTLNPNDVISQKFYNDHICLIRKDPPKNLPAFCRDFRQGPSIYQVMLLKANDICRLRGDLQGHRNDFYKDRYNFRPLHPGAALKHYTTDGTYTFIYCKKSKGTWIGKIKSNHYQQYVPQGTAGNPEGVYQIYHGCPPVVTYPGFSKPGTC